MDNKNPVILSVKNLNVYFKTHGKDAHVIRGINIDIKREECFAIVGESGSGKSVFTKTFTGMLDSNGKIKSGTIIMNDVPISDPRIIHARFRDIHRYEREERKRAARSVSAVYDRRIAARRAERERALRALEQQEALATKESHIELIVAGLKSKSAKQYERCAAYYADRLNRAYNRVSNNAVYSQKISDRLSRYLTNVLDERRFEDREHTEGFMLMLGSCLRDDASYQKSREVYNSLESELKKYADTTPGQKLTLQHLQKAGSRLAKDYNRVLKSALTSYLATQKPANPINSAAYDEYNAFVRNSLAPLFNAWLAANSGKSLTFSDSGSSVEIRLAEIGAFVQAARPLVAESTLPLSELEDESYCELLDALRSTLAGDKKHLRFLTEIERIDTQLAGVVDEESQRELTQKRAELRRDQILYEIDNFKDIYRSQVKYLKEQALTPSVSLTANVNELYTTIFSEATKVLELPAEVRKRILKVQVEEIRLSRAAAFQAIEKRESEQIASQTATVATDEAALKTLASRKEQLEKVFAADLPRLEAEKAAAIAARRSKNAAALEKSPLSAEEKELYGDYDPRDLAFLVARAARLQKAEKVHAEIVEKTNAQIAEAVAAFDSGDQEKLAQLSRQIGFNYDYYLNRERKVKKQTAARLSQIDAAIAKVSSSGSEKDKTRADLLKVEREAIEASDISNREQIKIELRKALSSYNVDNNPAVRSAEREVHIVANNVHGLRLLMRRLRRSTMLVSLRQRGVVRGGSVNLAKLKSNREWSMIRGSHIATIFQDPMTSLNPLLTIGSQISDVLRLHHNLTKSEAKKEAIELLRRVHIPNPEERYSDYPYQYSGGMRQRVVIAIALACRPDILICDEPTTALDVTVQAQILALIKELQKENHFTTIFITHDLGVVAGVADRIAVMYGGQIIEYGTDEDIFYSPAHPYTWALLSSLPQLAVDNEPLTYIRGNPPVFTDEIEGDAFAGRSDYAMRIDHMKEPPMFQISETHFAKTWLLDPRAPKVKKPALIRNLSERMKVTAANFLASTKGE